MILLRKICIHHSSIITLYSVTPQYQFHRHNAREECAIFGASLIRGTGWGGASSATDLVVCVLCV